MPGTCALCHQQATTVTMTPMNTMPVQAHPHAPAMHRHHRHHRPHVLHMRVMPGMVHPLMPGMPGGMPLAPVRPAGPVPPEVPDAPNRADPPAPALSPAVQRSLDNPPVTEINSAKALNDLLLHLATQPTDDGDTAPVELDATILSSINVTSTRSGAGFGALKYGGRLSWPPALQELAPEQEAQALRGQIESQIQDAIRQGREGQVEKSLLTHLRKDVDQLRSLLKRDVQRFSVSSYLEAKRFLSDLDDALKVLRESDVAHYLNGRYAPRGRTVAELIRYMADNQLTFAPAVAGDEPAYAKLRQALVAASMPVQPSLVNQR
jgi:hypothetical protein